MSPQEKREGISELGIILRIICMIAACLGIYLLLFYFEGVFHVGEMQAAVDQQCGKNRIVVDWQNISSDPGLNWYQDGFSCDKLTGEIVCRCGE